MIYYLVHQQHGYTVDRYLNGFGAPLRGQITILPYEYLAGMPRLRAGTYIFSDVERLSRSETAVATAVWDALSSWDTARVLNHPTRTMRRYELLRTMRAHCINTFDAYRLTEARPPKRFPVFLREENEHTGSLTPLLETPEQLEAAVEAALASGVRRDDCLIVEFCDTSDCHGTFRKYTACKVGGRIVPTHVLFGNRWMLKTMPADYEGTIAVGAQLAEQAEYVYENPHEQELRQVFELGRFDYGRIDYAMLDGKMQVWEINSNPNMLGHSALRPGCEDMAHHSAEQLLAAFATIDDLAGVRESIPNPVRSGVWSRTFRQSTKSSFRTSLALLGLGGYGRAAETKLAPLKRLLG
jgi:hypothetical protein